ncbi:type II toxin-antitoxin system RelE/ParE family toxin [Massilia sp. CCM 8734]|uniref:type II toxin-antitoxin system RelE/ParE family toxin n=1 Tax=Massilia sp. CCM 8734 TaxID=2609283 RepID=UPI0014200FDB|nr:type II toxin-antitoxin system RelE/ParE family toxin [Massilia sp. CCM 8734]NHZ95336.1 hypothetical protein [Massilia sp. CCM 8734]
MAYTVNILDVASEDIVRMDAYVRSRWGDAVADKSYVALMDRLTLLASQPLMGVECDELASVGILDLQLSTAHQSVISGRCDAQCAVCPHGV